jgi:hypothetical protein
MSVNYLDPIAIHALSNDAVFETAVRAGLILASIQQRSVSEGGEIDFQGDSEKEAKYHALCDNILNNIEAYTRKFKLVISGWPDYLYGIDFTQNPETGEWSSPDFHAGGGLMYTIRSVLWEKIK